MSTSKTRVNVVAIGAGVVCAVAVLVLIAYASASLTSLRAWGWHLRNGTTLRIHQAEMQVPWRYGVLEDKERISYDIYKWKRPLAFSLGDSPVYPASEIEQHADRAQTAFKAHGNTGVEVRNLKVDGGELACIDVGIYPNEEEWMKRLRSWHCESTFGVRISLMGAPADVDEIWKLIEGIRVR